MCIFCGLEYFVCVWIFCRNVYFPNKCTKLINLQRPLQNGNIWKVYFFFGCCWHFQITAPSADNKRDVKLLLAPDRVTFVIATIIYSSYPTLFLAPRFWEPRDQPQPGFFLEARERILGARLGKYGVKWLKQLNYCLRADLFATYACSCRLYSLEFLIVFRLKYNKNFQPANATAIRVCCKWIHPKLGPVYMEVGDPR